MSSTTEVGKTRRMNRLLSSITRRIVLVPLDDSLITGPTTGLEQLRSKVELIVKHPPDAIMGFAGLFRNHSDFLSRVPGILNLTASTIRSQHTRKTLIGTVDQAVQLGLDAVAVHVNISSRYESEMIHILGVIAQECDSVGMPLLAIMYPRSETDSGDENYNEIKLKDRQRYAELVAHAARVGTELGADIIKTQYTGDPESFRFVVEACAPVPVVVSGGPVLPPDRMLQTAYEAICAGGAGVSFGRNVFSRPDPRPFIAALRGIVHDGLTTEAALERITKFSAPA